MQRHRLSSTVHGGIMEAMMFMMFMMFMTALTLVTSASGASLVDRPRADGQTSQGSPPSIPETNVMCYLNQPCSLQCAAKGDVKEFYVGFGDNDVPAAYYPDDGRWHQHVDFWGITSVSVEQPGRGAVLQLTRVQRKHEGRYKFTVKYSSGGDPTEQYVNLQVHTADLKEPEPPEGWTARSVTTARSITTARSVTTAPSDTAAENDAPDRSYLHFLWLLLIPGVVGLVGLIYFCHVKVVQIIRNLLLQVGQIQCGHHLVPQVPPDPTGSTQQKGHHNGLKKASPSSNGLPNGDSVTKV